MNDGKREEDKRNGGSIDEVLEIAEKNKSRIIVSQDGTADVKTIKEAIERIPWNNKFRVIVEIKPGTYWEQIIIPKIKPFITFEGSANNLGEPAVAIKGNASVSGSRKTFDTATVAIDSDYFRATNVKFENTFEHEEGSKGSQAVALRISGTKASFLNCSFYGYQDTLYDHRGLHYFNNCFIQGSVDFICGYGKSLYENCIIKSSVAKNEASVTAQRRSVPNNESGFSFKNCKVTGSGHAFLGRAWGTYSRVVFSYTFMDQLVLPEGWNDWGDKERQSKVYYGEYKCSGAGANMSKRVTWARRLTDEEATPFLGTYFINGDSWLLNKPPHI
ncbi:hypothetical protein Leryth_004867 [Lithospermum erythrorhizon]|nr:hypothetical protein Leryth_004867 [Lithospermum erythrorhizon]